MTTAATGAPPAIHSLVAPAEWSAIDFISDIHLAIDMPRTFEAWAAYLLATPADAVFILGDLFDAWVGDDARSEGFDAKCAELLAQAARRRRIGLMVGNRDFLLGEAMLADCGLLGLPDPTVLHAFGERVLLTHGDTLCTDDADYQKFRTLVRDPRWQRQFLAKPLAERRAFAAQARGESRKHTSAAKPEIMDVNQDAVAAAMRAHGVRKLIHGHTHRPATHHFDLDGHTAERIVLGDWYEQDSVLRIG